MDIVRAAVMALAALLLAVIRFVAGALALIVGRIDWQAPAWLPPLQRSAAAGVAAVRARPHRYGGIAVSVLALAALGMLGYRWWQALPRPPAPVAVTFQVSAPGLTDYRKQPIVVQALRVEFSDSAAALALVGKPVSAGIRMSPELAGTWTFSSDRELVFRPQDDWPVGQHFEVRFDRALVFAPQVRVAETEFEFDSAPFTAQIAQVEFYQDPQDAALKKAIAQVRFSHPVDPLALEKRIAMTLGETGRNKPRPLPQKFVVSYDDDKLNAYVHSQPLALPLDPGLLSLHIDKGVHAARGGTPFAETLQGEVAVPGKYSLAIESVEPTLVDNARFEPEQVLMVAASQAVGERDINQKLSAWLLPEHHPKSPETDRRYPYNWSGSARDMSEGVLAAAQKLDLDPVATELEYQTLHSYKYKADVGRYLYVRVESGLTSFGGFMLGKPAAFVVRVPDYPRMLRFMADGALLSLKGEQRVAVVARNVPGLRLDIGRVLPEQLSNLAALNYGSFAKPQLSGLSPDQITERFEQTLTFADAEPGKAHYEGIDLSRYLRDGGKRGVFLLALRNYDPEAERRQREAAQRQAAAGQELRAADLTATRDYANDYVHDNYRTNLQDTRLVVVTDLGVLLKKSMDGSLDVFVQSLEKGEPVAGASVEILGKNGQRLLALTSDAQGHAHVAALDGFEREKTPSLLVVRKGEDLSFLPLRGGDRQLDTSRFDVGGIRNADMSGQLSAWLFSDRGLYRPGDTFNIGMIVRTLDWQRSLEGVPLQVDIVDPRGLRVDRRRVQLGKEGFEELGYTTQEASPTGAWTVSLSLVRHSNQVERIGSVTVQVKEFLPDRMKASAHLSSEASEGWVKPDALSARFSLQNLFGTPATARRVQATLTLNPAFPSFRSYPDFQFYDPQRAKDGYTEALGEQTTNDKGEAEFALDLSKYANASYRLLFVARGFEAEGGRSVSAEVSSLVSSRDYLIGVKADGDLDAIRGDARRVVRLIAIDPGARQTAVDGLKTVLLERRYASILTRQDSGVYKYESKLKEVPLREDALAIPTAGLDLSLPTDAPGSYALLVKNAAGEELNRVLFTVAGNANISRSLERNAELQLTLDKHDYAPGEEIEIAVRAPYAGSGLITIERDKVYAQQWFKAASTGSVQHIRVPADFTGNGYVNVQYVRDPGSEEIFMSPLSYAIVPFSVSRAAHQLALKVDAPALVKPGTTLRMKVHTASPARVAVFAVDEGILQVARYQLGDPLDHFLQKRMLQVQTRQILDLILPEFAQLLAAAAPGGDADALLGRHLNPFRKKRAAPVAYWSGLIDVDGEGEVSYAIPEDFNGQLRLMAVAVSGDTMGVFEGSTTVRGDFVLSPNAPAMVAPGDEFEVSVGVANNVEGLGDTALPITVKIEPEAQLQVIDAAEQTLTLGGMREGVAIFRLRAMGEPGASRLRFSASSGKYAATLGADVSVRPAQPYRNTLVIGSLGEGDKTVGPLRELYLAFAKREAAASYSPLVLANGLSGYLDAFPHQCTEQVLSRAMPGLVLAQYPEFGTLHSTDSARARTGFADLMALLRSRQNAEGGFGYWMPTVDVQPYVAVYTMQFLIEARERGWEVPAEMLSRGNDYLKRLVNDESDGSLPALRERAFAIYLLTRQQQVTSNAIAAVRERLDAQYPKQWQSDSVAAYLAASLKLLKLDREAERLIAAPAALLSRDAIELEWNYDRFHDPLIRDASVLFLLSRHFPERAAELPPKALANIVQVLGKGRYNTLSSALTVLALGTYSDRFGTPEDGELRFVQTDAKGGNTSIGKADGLVLRAAFDAAAKALQVSNGADQAAWYSVSETGFDRNPPDSEIRDGLEIVREFTNAEGKVVDTVTLGEEIQVHLKIRALRGAGYGNVAIVDLLPGGFEPVQELAGAAPTPVYADDARDGGEEYEGDHDDGDVVASQPSWRPSIGLDSSNFALDYADVRDDRIVIYGYAGTRVSQFVYRIKATNAGRFVVPPAYAESMYERTVQARSRGGAITVQRP
ncbi:MAG: alpha-2-macroglobulin [Gammaproteobacteria bacterium HGW-Gammaproteobacteria-4]|nr:MAG: alpha-2-macroglobulin [Gammaproteobacteria bacterium HGW-Gammaproteobacteria-4]